MFNRKLYAQILVAKNEMIHDIDGLFTRNHMSIMGESFLYDNFKKIENYYQTINRTNTITFIHKKNTY